MAENSGIRFLKYYAQKLKSFFFSKDILSFLLFLAISAGFWYVHALGKERERNLIIPIHFVGLPLNVNFTNSPPTEISLNVKDQGIRLFDYSTDQLSPLVIDVSRPFGQKGEILIPSDQLRARISKYLKPTTTILDIHPDSILIKYEKLYMKTLPIVLNSNIELTHQYKFSEDIKIQPFNVTVYGPRKILDTLKTISTELLELKNVSDTCYYNCKLKQIKSLRYSVNKTRVSLFVEQFTERKVQLPITALNCPENLSVRTFPALVNATYTVGLSRFNILNPLDIQVYLDYNDLKLNKLSKQVLKIKNNTTYISNIRISPLEVEFILEQK
jgi:hypothetical protein